MVHIVNQTIDPYVSRIAVHPVQPKEHDAVGHLFTDALHLEKDLLGLGVIQTREPLPYMVAISTQPFDVRLSISKRGY